jgi:phage tail-like protein
MRGPLPGLASPHPLGPRLPGVFVDDDFTQRFVSAFDTVLAPVFATLDCLDAYLDPAVTPDDFLTWLAGWVALELAEDWPEPRRRELVRHAIALHRWRGTRRGLVEHVRLVTGGEVEVADSGGCGWSPEPGGALPGSAGPGVRVTVRVADPAAVDQRRLRRAVAVAVPAHVTTTVEVTGT